MTPSAIVITQGIFNAESRQVQANNVPQGTKSVDKKASMKKVKVSDRTKTRTARDDED
jgi:hypothetical protein